MKPLPMLSGMKRIILWAFVNFGGFVARAKSGGTDDPFAVKDGVEQGVGFVVIVVDARAFAPAGGGEIQGHDEIFFAVGGGGLGVRGAVDFAGPGEITVVGVFGVGLEHVSFGPIPDRVEFLFVVELNGDGHAVAHAFGAGVVIGPVGNVGEFAVGVRAVSK